MNIVVKTNAAESPWRNGLLERHNAVIDETMNKTLEDTKCSLKVALAWTLHEKNSLSNAHGCSPCIIVFGSNPKLPSALNNRPPALEEFTSSKLIADNLNAMQRAREAFIMSEASKRIKRALRHNIRTSGDTKYFTGDRVYIKKKDSNHWSRPGTLPRQEGQQVLVNIGSFYHRVHPCRIIFTGAMYNKDVNDQVSELPTEINPEMQQSNSCTVDVEIESDEGDIDSHVPENSQDVSEASTDSRIGQVCD